MPNLLRNIISLIIYKYIFIIAYFLTDQPDCAQSLIQKASEVDVLAEADTCAELRDGGLPAGKAVQTVHLAAIRAFWIDGIPDDSLTLDM